MEGGRGREGERSAARQMVLVARKGRDVGWRKQQQREERE